MAESSLPHPDYKSYLSEPEACCNDFIMQQTMMRIKDPKASLDFYSRVMGMRSVLNTNNPVCIMFTQF